MRDEELKKEDEEMEEILKNYFHAKPQKDCFLYEDLLYDYAYKEDLNVCSPSFTPDLEKKVHEHLANCPHCYGKYLGISVLIKQKPTEEELQLIKKKVAEYSPEQKSHPAFDQVMNWVFGLWERGKEWGGSLLPQGDLQPAFVVMGGVQPAVAARNVSDQYKASTSLVVSPGSVVKLNLDKGLSLKRFQGYWVTLFLKGPDEKHEFIGSFTIADKDDGVLDWNVPDRPGAYRIEMYVTANAPAVEGIAVDTFLQWFDSEQGEKNRSETTVVIE
jgi:hypothetical protein